jgi:putative chitinase
MPIVENKNGSGSPTISRGSTGPNVFFLQQALGVTPSNGQFGPITEAKLREFQANADLTADGIAGPATWVAIHAAALVTAPLKSSNSTGQGDEPLQMIDINILIAVASATPIADLQALVDPMSAACRRFDIDTPVRLAAFLSQCAHESGGFTRRAENLSYHAVRLMQVWPKRFPTLNIAQQFEMLPEKLANTVYAERMGNGDAASGDGWRFRGRGFEQLTGRGNYTRLANALGMHVDDAPDYVMTDEGACVSASWFWSVNNLNPFADARDISGLTQKINGGLGGIDQRVALFGLACKACGI